MLTEIGVATKTFASNVKDYFGKKSKTVFAWTRRMAGHGLFVHVRVHSCSEARLSAVYLRRDTTPIIYHLHVLIKDY